MIYSQPILFKIYNFTGLNNEKAFIIFIGIASLLLFSTSLILKSLTIYSQILYVEVCESGLTKGSLIYILISLIVGF